MFNAKNILLNVVEFYSKGVPFSPLEIEVPSFEFSASAILDIAECCEVTLELILVTSDLMLITILH